MALGTSLITLVDMLKAELGNNLDTGVATADDTTLRRLLANKQTWWAHEYDWPDLELKTTVATVASQRYYIFPPTISRDRPLIVEAMWNQYWIPLAYGIDAAEFAFYNSDSGEAADPVRNWQLHGLEVASPPPQPTAVLEDSGLTGVYKYYTTFVTANGETALSEPLILDITDKSVTVDVPASSSSYVTARRMYRTKSNGTTIYFLQSFPGNTATVYPDPSPDTDLTVVYAATTSATVQTYEVWPIPASSGTGVRFTGQVPLPRLTQDGDAALLDDMLLVLSVAADRLARYDSADARLKLSQAQQIAARLGATLPRRSPKFSLIGRNEQPVSFLPPTNIRINPLS